MKTYITVSGTARLVESVSEQRAVLTLTVGGTKSDAALKDASLLRDEVIRALKAAGLRDDELSEGGRETWQPWYQKKEQPASYRVLLSCKDAPRLYRAIDALQPLFEKSRLFEQNRNSLNVHMLEPRFAASPEAEAAAHAAAIRDARSKAQALAQEAGVALGAVARIEEQGSYAENSGAYGDPAPAGAFMARSAAPESADLTPLADAQRIRTLNYQVRFLIAG